MKVRLRSPVWRRLVRTLARLTFRFAENNDNEPMRRNGERWLMHELLSAHAATKSNRSFILCDAGANTGDYAQSALEVAAQVGCAIEIHAFEPSPLNETALRTRFALQPVQITAVALAAQPGEAPLYAGLSGSGHASLLPRKIFGDVAPDGPSVRLMRLDEYVAKERVAHIDLLKLDIEGAELSALQGLGDYLSPEFVDAIQFEYGGATLDAGTSLRELYGFLQARSFVVAKLFPRAIELREYREWMETFAFANYVALSKRWLKRGGGARSAA